MVVLSLRSNKVSPIQALRFCFDSLDLTRLYLRLIDLAAVELQLSKTWKYAPLSNLKSILSKVSQYAQSIRNAIVSVVKSAIDPNPSSKSSTRSSSLPPSLLLALDSATGNGRGVRVTRHGNPNLVDTAVALERPCFSVLLRAINSGGSADKYFATKAPSTDGQGEYAIAIKLLSQGSTADMVGEENRKMMGKSGGKAVEMVPLTGRSRVAYSEVPFARGISKNGAFGGSLLSLASFDRYVSSLTFRFLAFFLMSLSPEFATVFRESPWWFTRRARTTSIIGDRSLDMVSILDRIILERSSIKHLLSSTWSSELAWDAL